MYGITSWRGLFRDLFLPPDKKPFKSISSKLPVYRDITWSSSSFIERVKIVLFQVRVWFKDTTRWINYTLCYGPNKIGELDEDCTKLIAKCPWQEKVQNKSGRIPILLEEEGDTLLNALFIYPDAQALPGAQALLGAEALPDAEEFFSDNEALSDVEELPFDQVSVVNEVNELFSKILNSNVLELVSNKAALEIRGNKLREHISPLDFFLIFLTNETAKANLAEFRRRTTLWRCNPLCFVGTQFMDQLKSSLFELTPNDLNEKLGAFAQVVGKPEDAIRGYFDRKDFEGLISFLAGPL